MTERRGQMIFFKLIIEASKSQSLNSFLQKVQVFLEIEKNLVRVKSGVATYIVPDPRHGLRSRCTEAKN